MSFNEFVHDVVPNIPFPDLIVDRTEWEALTPLSDFVVREKPFTVVVTSFTETNVCSNNITCLLGVQRLQKYYMEKEKLPDLPYNFIIGGNGLVFVCRGWSQRAQLPVKYNYLEPYALHIGFVGKYGDSGCLSDDMTTSRRELIKLGMDQSHIAKEILYFQFIK